MERGRQTDLMHIAMHSTGDCRSNFIICALEKVMSMIQQGIAYMAEIFEMYFQNVGYIILVCAVILLLLTRYRKKEVTHLLFVCGIILILFLNPVVIYLVCSLKRSGYRALCQNILAFPIYYWNCICGCTAVG